MNQLTVRGFDEELQQRLRQIAKERGVSLNKAVLYLLRKGAGLDRPKQETDVVGDSLDHLIGTWTAEEAETFLEAIDICEQIDDSFWA